MLAQNRLINNEEEARYARETSITDPLMQQANSYESAKYLGEVGDIASNLGEFTTYSLVGGIPFLNLVLSLTDYYAAELNNAFSQGLSTEQAKAMAKAQMYQGGINELAVNSILNTMPFRGNNVDDVLRFANKADIDSGDIEQAKRLLYNEGTKTLKNGKTLNEMSILYTKKVYSNKMWSWDMDMPSGLKRTERTIIKNYAIRTGMIPDVPIREIRDANGRLYKYADFKAAGLVEETVSVPEHLWKVSNSRQFEWADKKIGGKREGYTWHHSEETGKLELVPAGIHNVFYHYGGRSINHWAYEK